MANLFADLIGSLLAMPGKFAAVAAHDPLSALLLLVGAGLTLGAVAVFGYLTLGAAVEFVTPEPSSPAPERRAR